MTCVTLGQGTALLSADDLTDLDLTCDEGFVLVELQVGFPAERPVVRSRALDDGVLDQSTFVGQRAVTATLRLDQNVMTTQALLDRLMPFLSPRRRPTLRWSLPGSASDYRSLTLRGVDAPLVINQPGYVTIVCSWVSSDAFLLDPDVTCDSVSPLDPPEEVGRYYDLTFDRVYVPALPVGALAAVNTGTAPTHCTITLDAAMVNPTVTINGAAMTFTENGGLTLVTGQTLVIDTQARTILLNNDPTQSRYDRVNFEDWSWDDLLLQPGVNVVRLQGSSFDATSLMTVCWQSAWW